MKRILGWLISIVLLFGKTQTLYAALPENTFLCEETQEKTQERTEEEAEEQLVTGPELEARSAFLMEADGGKILFEKNSQEQLAPASVTKIMTLLLIFDALDSGKLHMEDSITTSEYAASMGGSQVFLEPGETQTADTMIKCISVASANDACVAMAEHISGSEEAFVAQMNERAKGLGMERTTFQNCNGLDAEGHVTTAKDIGIMSRELVTKYPEIEKYSTIWMDTITHTTKKGSSEFGLANTNKLIRQYKYATGLKTGSTNDAGFCLSATARKDGVELISVVMACPDAKTRVKDSVALLNYGFGICTRYEDKEGLTKKAEVKVIGGVQDKVSGEVTEQFAYTDTNGRNPAEMEKKVTLKKKMKAPVKKGETIGELVYVLNETEVGRILIKARTAVGKLTYKKALLQTLRQTFTV